MKKSLLFLSTLLIVLFYFHTASAQTGVIINEFSQGDNNGTNDHEWIELIVTADNTDLRGLYLTSISKDTATPGGHTFPSSPDLTIGLQLDSVSLFQNLQKGQIIVIYKAPTNDGKYDTTLNAGSDTQPTTDISFADGNGLLIASDNSTYFSGVWPGFKNWNSSSASSHGDAVGLFTSTGTGVFGLSYGDGWFTPTNPISANYGTVTISSSTALVAGQEVYFNSSDPGTANSSSSWTWLSYTDTTSSPTPKYLNGGNNDALPVELSSFSASVNGS